MKNFAGINFCESTFSEVKKGIYFRKFGQNSRNSRNFLPTKISSLKVCKCKNLLFLRIIIIVMKELWMVIKLEKINKIWNAILVSSYRKPSSALRLKLGYSPSWVLIFYCFMCYIITILLKFWCCFPSKYYILCRKHSETGLKQTP